MNKRTHWLPIACVCLFACAKPSPTQQEEKKHGEHTITLSKEFVKKNDIQWQILEKQWIATEVQANGVVDVPPQNYGSVSSPMAGYVTYTNVLPGSKVSKGQLLAKIEHQSIIDLQQQFLQSNSRLVALEKEWIRQKELVAENVTSQKRGQGAESEYKNEKAQWEALYAKLKLIGFVPEKVLDGKIQASISITSPLSGYVKNNFVTLGKYVSPDFLMFEIVDLSHLHLEIKIFEKDIPKIKKGQQLKFIVPSAPGDTMAGTVVLLGKNFDPINKILGVHAHFDEKKYANLLPGMYVQALIQVDHHQGLVLPENAIVQSQGKPWIFLGIDSTDQTYTFLRKEIQGKQLTNKGLEFSDSKELENRWVVTKGAYFIQAETTKGQEEE